MSLLLLLSNKNLLRGNLHSHIPPSDHDTVRFLQNSIVAVKVVVDVVSDQTAAALKR